MNIVSPDITSFDAQVAFDLSGLNPLIAITNLSTGPNLAGVTFWVVATSPSGTNIHAGSQSSPDAIGAWSVINLVDPWPRPYSQIEWTGAPYSVSIFAMDTTGAIFEVDKTASICRPTGNTQDSKNVYGIASTNVKVLCQQARIYFEDTTGSSYQGLSGTQLTSMLKVVYPVDPTFSIPAPFSINSFTNAMVPISYSSDNYQFLSTSTYSYDLGNNVSVIIRYQQIQTFSVLCNIDLMPLICEYEKLIDSIQNGTCVDVNSANQKLMLINPKFALAIMGIMQPLTGVDVASLIEDIQEIGGFTCNCCTSATGIIPASASVIDGYTFSIVPVCGDISGNITQTGTNIQINLSDKQYVFAFGTSTGTTAFTVTPATTGCVKTYTMTVDTVQLATDILTVISTNPGLVNLFNSIVTNSGTNLIVDGACIFDSTTSFNYGFTIPNVPAATTFALLTGIQQGLTNRSLNFSFNLTSLTALQSYLNGLGIGTFVVTNPQNQDVLISSTANTNKLSNLAFSIGGASSLAAQTSSATGFTALSANTVVQNIINYLCGITDAEIATSQDYVINYISPTGPATFTVPAGSTLSELLGDILSYNAQSLTNTSGNATVSCASMDAVFQVSNAAIGAADYFYGKKNGQCARIAFSDAFAYMVSNMTPSGVAAFCASLTACGAGKPCQPYNYLNVIATNYSTSCSEIAGINYTLS